MVWRQGRAGIVDLLDKGAEYGAVRHVEKRNATEEVRGCSEEGWCDREENTRDRMRWQQVIRCGNP